MFLDTGRSVCPICLFLEASVLNIETYNAILLLFHYLRWKNLDFLAQESFRKLQYMDQK